MPLKDQAWGTIVSFRADSTMKRILKAVTFHTETTVDHCSNPEEFKLGLKQEEVQSQFCGGGGVVFFFLLQF